MADKEVQFDRQIHDIMTVGRIGDLELAMTFITLEELQARLPEIIEKQIPGEELFITKDEQIVARLMTEPKRSTEPRQLGTLKGTVLYVAPDFNAPLEEFKEYMP